MKFRHLFLTILFTLALVGSCLGSNKIIDLRLSGDLLDSKGVLAAGEIKRSSAATYINEGILYTADGDDTPFSNASIEDETGYTDMRGSFVDGQAWFDGLIPTALTNNVTGITKANPGVVSSVAHGLSVGDLAYFDSLTEMTELNSKAVAVSAVGSVDLFSINDTSGYGAAETTGGACGHSVVSLEDFADTGNQLIINDGSGNLGYGFIGEVGTGETLGAELLTNGNMETDDPPSSWTTQNSTKDGVADERTGGAGIQSIEITATSDNGSVYQSFNTVAGKLYKVVLWNKSTVGDTSSVIIQETTGWSTLYASVSYTDVVWTENTFYFVAETAQSIIVCRAGTNTEIVYFDDISVKEVTEPAANACHIYKEHGLLNEGWNAIDTGIDYSAGTAWDFDVYVNLLSSSGGTAQSRFEDGWLLVEPEGTNHCLYSRDLSNAVWAKTDCTGAKSQIGLDGVANSASLLTATGANATAFQTLGMASSAKSYYVYIKRSAGTGTISITDNGGTNYTECTGLSSTSFTKYRITRTQATPVVGFKITTSGDAITIDCNQLEQTTFSTSFIPTLSIPVTRTTEAGSAADNGYSWTITQALKNILDDAEPAGGATDSQGTLLFDVKWGCDESDIAAADNGLVAVNDAAQGLAYFDADSFDTHDDSLDSTIAHPAFSAGDTIYYAVRWGDVDGNANDISAGLSDGTWVFDGTPANYDGEYGLGTDLRLSFSNLYPLHIRNIEFHDTPYSQAELGAGIYRRVLKWMMHFELP